LFFFKDSSSEEDSDLDRTLPVEDAGFATEIVPMTIGPPSSSSPDSSDSEDDVFKLSQENEKLNKELKELKSSLDQCRRDLTLANNVRIAEKEQFDEAKKDLEEKTKQVATLLSRNKVLQYLLCTLQEGNVVFLNVMSNI